ncbi:MULTISPECIES: histone deacetylase family protein [unclassified Legionella]|uniref:histone deacetylase family protein n=1 Tax=unclassified Legionella TaxID=2622702 RepID=UPI001056E0E6|nr:MULTISPECIES: histone deacetylase family protein [unclassified Legionella]MDI9818864.1 histone deacetylase family protein [Legionella sp. PL877]
MTIGFISHPDCLLHKMGDYHPEQPARLQVIEQEVFNSDLKQFLQYYQAPLATREQLLRVHEESYVEFIYQASPKEGFVPLDPDVLMNPYSLTAALRAAGSVIKGVDLVMNNEVDTVFCNVRPPGHHAERDKAMGFCLFNNVAVGVAYAMEHFNLKQIAIIDFDVHHGNGTENIFLQENRVLYCSTFEHPFYPFSGAYTKSRHIINIPLPAGTMGEQFREQVEEHWLNQIAEFAPEMIFFSAGFDAYYQDELADLMLTADDYLWITQKIKKIAIQFSEGRMVSVLEGGYNLNGLGQCVLAHLRGLIED